MTREKTYSKPAIKARYTLSKQARQGPLKNLSASCRVFSRASLPLYVPCKGASWRKSVLPYSILSCTLWQPKLSRTRARGSTNGQVATAGGPLRKESSKEATLPTTSKGRLRQRNVFPAPALASTTTLQQCMLHGISPGSGQVVLRSLLSRM